MIPLHCPDCIDYVHRFAEAKPFEPMAITEMPTNGARMYEGTCSVHGVSVIAFSATWLMDWSRSHLRRMHRDPNPLAAVIPLYRLDGTVMR